jgi:hypothetical protein
LEYIKRRIFRPKRNEVMGGYRKLHNEELHNLYYSPSVIRMIKSRRMRWVVHVARMREKRNAYRILVGKPEGKRQLGRPRRSSVDKVKVDHVLIIANRCFENVAQFRYLGNDGNKSKFDSEGN